MPGPPDDPPDESVPGPPDDAPDESVPGPPDDAVPGSGSRRRARLWLPAP